MKQLTFAAIAALSLSSCVIEDDDDVFASAFPGPGVLVVDWTIQGAKDPNLCFELGADTISILIETSSGAFVGDFRQSCGVFETSIALEPGSYIADAALLDAAGVERTTSVEIDRFSIFGDDELLIPIDFPFDSFF